MIQSAYKLYGSSDGFWTTFNNLAEAVTQRNECCEKEVTEQIKGAFKQRAQTVSALEEAF